MTIKRDRVEVPEAGPVEPIEARLASARYVDEPEALYAELRARDPVHRSPSGRWFVTGHHELGQLMRNRLNEAQPPAAAPLAVAPTVLALQRHGIIYLNGSAHRAQRRALAPYFTPQEAERRRPGIRRRAEQLLDELAGEDLPDLVTRYAQPLTLATMSEVMGVPLPTARDAALFDARLASHALVSDPLPSSLTPRRLARAEKAAQQAVALVASLAAAGEVPPDSGLVALLRWAEGAGFDHVAAVGALHLVFGAGYFTSLNLVSVTSFEMLRLPVARRTALLEATPLATVVEEVARMISPVQMTTRVPREPVPVGQHVIPADEQVLAVFAAANRDPTEFPDPDAFLPGRPGRHVAFGLGEHHCIGAHLGRVQAQEAVAALLRRFPNGATAEERLQWRGVGNSRRVVRVRLR